MTSGGRADPAADPTGDPAAGDAGNPAADPARDPAAGPAGEAAEGFVERLTRRVERSGPAICLGIDPRPERNRLTDPKELAGDPATLAERVADSVVDYFTAILDACHEELACCKPQIAFFEALGAFGMSALQRVMTAARERDLPVLLDAKRGDIGSTAEAYAETYLDDGPLAADALTLNPYLGLDTLEPFLARARSRGRALFVVVRTSNPGSGDIQGLRLDDGRDVSEALADALARTASALPLGARGYGPLGAVLGATHQAALARLRRRMPNSLVLVPGYGAQGGTAGSAAAAFDADGHGAILSASRSISYLGGESYAEVGSRARLAVERMRADLDDALARRLRGSA